MADGSIESINALRCAVAEAKKIGAGLVVGAVVTQ
jgi:hypothetical protein